MGWPVSHSRSPRLHGYWLDLHGIDGGYIPLAVPPDRLAEAIRGLTAVGFRGANVTVPHKEAARHLVDTVDPTAERIGAVNTIVVNDDGRLVGSNTDAFGFIESLNEAGVAAAVSEGPSVVLGAGGAARAVVAALVDAGAPENRLVNRTVERAKALVQDIGGPIRVIDWSMASASLAEAAFVVNTTSLGMTGQASLDMRLDTLPIEAVVTDLVYNPLETELLAAARERGNRVVDGLGMLLHQARPGFSAWFGVMPAVTADLRDFVVDDH